MILFLFYFGLFVCLFFSQINTLGHQVIPSNCYISEVGRALVCRVESPGFDPQGDGTRTWDREEDTAFPLQTARPWCTVETLLTDTLVSGRFYLLPPSQNPFSLNCHSNSVSLHPCKRLAPVTHVFHVLTVSTCSIVVWFV